MSVSAARENLPGVLEQARVEAVVLERYGRRVAVVISPEYYDHLVEAREEFEDLEAFDAAMAEEGSDLPWDQVKIDLGWT
jgi:antitoxin Phd